MLWVDWLALVYGGCIWCTALLLAYLHGRGLHVLDLQIIDALALLVALPWFFLRAAYFAVTGRLRAPPRQPTRWITHDPIRSPSPQTRFKSG
ncbi:MAG: hypothetical protein JO001_04170 [Alphaproteobacteria bacterium]|nr:hypothetical protein [Alphaproteobacteria bacterium]